MKLSKEDLAKIKDNISGVVYSGIAYAFDADVSLNGSDISLSIRICNFPLQEAVYSAYIRNTLTGMVSSVENAKEVLDMVREYEGEVRDKESGDVETEFASYLKGL